jgi:hypothetical protein
MALDTDKVLDDLREKMKLAILETDAGHRQTVKDAFDLFSQLDDALCAGEDLPSEWLTESPEDDLGDDVVAGDDDA